MEHAGIDVAEHAVDQPAAVERGAELRDVVGELLGGYGRVLDERDGAAAARHVAQEPYRLLAHAPDALHRPIREGGFRPMAVLLGFVAVLGDAGCAGDGLPLRPARIPRHREATAAARPALLLEERGHAFQLRREIVGVVGQQLDQVDSLGRALGIVGEELLHLVPDDVLAGEPQHPRVDGLDRGRLHGDQGARVAQGGIEAVVADVHQRRVLRDRQHVELGFGDEAERALRPAQDGVEVEASLAVADMGEVVAGERAVELREALGDQRLVVAVDGVHQPVDGPDAVGSGLDRLELLLVQRARGPDRAVEQHGGERQHMVAGLAVDARALAARIGVDHAADGGAVRGRQLRREEQPVRLQRLVELILHHPGLDPNAPPRGVDLQDAVHVARQVDDEAVGQGLTVGAGAAAARRQLERAKARLGGNGRDAHEILGARRKGDRLGKDLVDRVVGREHRAVGMGEAELPLEATGAQLGEERSVQRRPVLEPWLAAGS